MMLDAAYKKPQALTNLGTFSFLLGEKSQHYAAKEPF